MESQMRTTVCKRSKTVYMLYIDGSIKGYFIQNDQIFRRHEIDK